MVFEIAATQTSEIKVASICLGVNIYNLKLQENKIFKLILV